MHILNATLVLVELRQACLSLQDEVALTDTLHSHQLLISDVAHCVGVWLHVEIHV